MHGALCAEPIYLVVILLPRHTQVQHSAHEVLTCGYLIPCQHSAAAVAGNMCRFECIKSSGETRIGDAEAAANISQGKMPAVSMYLTFAPSASGGTADRAGTFT